MLVDTRLASIFYRTDRPRAASLVKAVLASHPENADAQLLSAQLAFDARKLTEAMSARRCPDHAISSTGSSAFLERTGAAGAWSFQRGSQGLQRGGRPQSAGGPGASVPRATCSSSTTRWRPPDRSRTRSSSLRPATPRPVWQSFRRIACRENWRPPIDRSPTWPDRILTGARFITKPPALPSSNRTGRRRGKRWTASRRWMRTRGKPLKDGSPWTWAGRTSRVHSSVWTVGWPRILTTRGHCWLPGRSTWRRATRRGRRGPGRSFWPSIPITTTPTTRSAACTPTQAASRPPSSSSRPLRTRAWIKREYGLILAAVLAHGRGKVGRRQAAVRKSAGDQSPGCGGGE